MSFGSDLLFGELKGKPFAFGGANESKLDFCWCDSSCVFVNHDPQYKGLLQKVNTFFGALLYWWDHDIIVSSFDVFHFSDMTWWVICEEFVRVFNGYP